jgi:uncharacterized membrane protein YdjX (TVP38/TMEM64 family)|tara:strand:- start:918 stop:1130 length:213 start_codon:yes stop_codon:yes gene_type:complete
MLSLLGSLLSVFSRIAGFFIPYFTGKKAARAEYVEETLKKAEEKNEVRNNVTKLSASTVTQQLLDKWSRD